MEQLIALLKMIAPMSPTLEAHLRSIILRRAYKKGEIILPLGAVCDQIFYIESGLVRSYRRHKGQEISKWFMLEKDIVIAVISFHRRTPAREAHVALEDCICWGITYDQLEEAFGLFPGFERHGRLIEAEYYCRSEELLEDINNRSAQERYEILMEKHPDLVARVPNKYLASYLGVKDRTLSDMKKKYLDKKKKGNSKK
jgi:CRP-like cAMP-binding protein